MSMFKASLIVPAGGKVWGKVLKGFDPHQPGGYALVGKWLPKKKWPKVPDFEILQGVDKLGSEQEAWVLLGDVPAGELAVVAYSNHNLNLQHGLSQWCLLLNPAGYHPQDPPKALVLPDRHILAEVERYGDVAYHSFEVDTSQRFANAMTFPKVKSLDADMQKTVVGKVSNPFYYAGLLAWAQYGLNKGQAEVDGETHMLKKKRGFVALDDLKKQDNRRARAAIEMNHHVPLPTPYTWGINLAGIWHIAKGTEQGADVSFLDALVGDLDQLPPTMRDVFLDQARKLKGLATTYEVLAQAMPEPPDDPDGTEQEEREYIANLIARLP